MQFAGTVRTHTCISPVYTAEIRTLVTDRVCPIEIVLNLKTLIKSVDSLEQPAVNRQHNSADGRQL